MYVTNIGTVSSAPKTIIYTNENRVKYLPKPTAAQTLPLRTYR